LPGASRIAPVWPEAGRHAVFAPCLARPTFRIQAEIAGRQP
jgi:hypothetical protein